MEQNRSRIEYLPVERIKRPKEIDRIEISEEAVDELAENIKEQGLLQSPLVRPDGDTFEIVAGDRRILAIRKLGWTAVECVLKDLTDEQAAEARASENLARENLTIIEEARIYNNLHKKYGKTLDQIARKMGKSVAIIRRRLDLLKMPPCLQTAMHKKQISYGVAEALWPISDLNALEYYLGFAIDHGCTVAVARSWADDWKQSQRRMTEDQDEAQTLTSPMQSRPVYWACDICNEPEELKNVTMLRICQNCLKRIKLAQLEQQ